jgi:putative membrane protein
MVPGHGGSTMWILIAVAAIVVVLALRFAFRAARGASGVEDAPIEILEKRYARGEITKEEFERMKRDLGLY